MSMRFYQFTAAKYCDKIAILMKYSTYGTSDSEEGLSILFNIVEANDRMMMMIPLVIWRRLIAVVVVCGDEEIS